MLPDRHRALLTAFVDGELSNRERRLVARLLRRSREARQLLQQLQSDVRALQSLPHPRLSVDLSGRVLHAIAERGLTPGPRRIALVSSLSPWLGPVSSWAVAAAVLLSLGVAAYVYFVVSFASHTTPELVKKEEAPPDTPRDPEALGTSIARQEETPEPNRKDDKRAFNEQRAERKPTEVVRRPEPKPGHRSINETRIPAKVDAPLTDRLEMFQLDRVPDGLPVIFKLRDLEQETERVKLIAELRKDSNFRMELPCPHGSRALERVQNAAKAVRIGLVIEKQAQERIKLKWRTNYVLYLENVTPEELAKLVRQISIADRAAGKDKDNQFDRLVLMRMTPQNKKELSSLLGIDPTVPESNTKGVLGTDPKKPLTEQTARQVSESLAGQGRAVRSDASKTSDISIEHHALVLAYNPVRPAPDSEEIKRFLNTRQALRPGAIRVLIVLRG